VHKKGSMGFVFSGSGAMITLLVILVVFTIIFFGMDIKSWDAQVTATDMPGQNTALNLLKYSTDQGTNLADLFIHTYESFNFEPTDDIPDINDVIHEEDNCKLKSECLLLSKEVRTIMNGIAYQNEKVWAIETRKMPSNELVEEMTFLSPSFVVREELSNLPTADIGSRELKSTSTDYLKTALGVKMYAIQWIVHQDKALHSSAASIPLEEGSLNIYVHYIR
jgi:hypothetical protein